MTLLSILEVCFCLQMLTYKTRVSVICLSVASHISETSEAIAITFDILAASVMRMHHARMIFF